MKRHKFKVGDRVFATKNSIWGLKPMKVVKVRGIATDWDSIICENEDFPSHGAFFCNELERFTVKRQRELIKFIRLKKAERKMKRQLFGD